MSALTKIILENYDIRRSITGHVTTSSFYCLRAHMPFHRGPGQMD